MANSTSSFDSENTSPPLREGIELRTIRGRVFKWDTINGGPVLEEAEEANLFSPPPVVKPPSPVNESVPVPAPKPSVPVVAPAVAKSSSDAAKGKSSDGTADKS